MGAHQSSSRLYYRKFAKGYVIVNPNTFDVHGATLPKLKGRYTDIDDSPARTFKNVVNVPAESSLILIAK